jgi:hypothetical protein
MQSTVSSAQLIESIKKRRKKIFKPIKPGKNYSETVLELRIAELKKKYPGLEINEFSKKMSIEVYNLLTNMEDVKVLQIVLEQFRRRLPLPEVELRDLIHKVIQKEKKEKFGTR